MTNWVVRKVDSFWTTGWEVLNRDLEFRGIFTKWEEALAYAHHMARTITITLPRVKHDDHVIAGKGLYSLHVNHGRHCTDIYLGGWDGVTVENSHLEPLALYLLALAKKRECAP